MAREETLVRPERQGLKVSEILADAGDTVTAGQTLARLTLPEGGTLLVQAPVAGLIASFHGGDRRGRVGPGRGAVFDHRAQRIRPDRPGADPGPFGKLKVNQTARIKIIGARRGRRQGAPGGADRRAQQPARPGHHRDDHQPAPAGEFIRAGADQDRPELRRRGAAHRRALRHRRHRGAGGAARSGSRPSGSRSG